MLGLLWDTAWEETDGGRNKQRVAHFSVHLSHTRSMTDTLVMSFCDETWYWLTLCSFFWKRLQKEGVIRLRKSKLFPSAHKTLLSYFTLCRPSNAYLASNWNYRISSSVLESCHPSKVWINTPESLFCKTYSSKVFKVLWFLRFFFMKKAQQLKFTFALGPPALRRLPFHLVPCIVFYGGLSFSIWGFYLWPLSHRQRSNFPLGQ